MDQLVAETTVIRGAAGEVLEVDFGSEWSQLWAEAWGWGTAMRRGRSCTHHHAPTLGDFFQEVLARGILPQAKGVYPKPQLHGVKPTTTSALGGPGDKQHLTRSMTG